MLLPVRARRLISEHLPSRRWLLCSARICDSTLDARLSFLTQFPDGSARIVTMRQLAINRPRCAPSADVQVECLRLASGDTLFLLHPAHGTAFHLLHVTRRTYRVIASTIDLNHPTFSTCRHRSSSRAALLVAAAAVSLTAAALSLYMAGVMSLPTAMCILAFPSCLGMYAATLACGDVTFNRMLFDCRHLSAAEHVRILLVRQDAAYQCTLRCDASAAWSPVIARAASPCDGITLPDVCDRRLRIEYGAAGLRVASETSAGLLPTLANPRLPSASLRLFDTGRYVCTFHQSRCRVSGSVDPEMARRSSWSSVRPWTHDSWLLTFSTRELTKVFVARTTGERSVEHRHLVNIRAVSCCGRGVQVIPLYTCGASRWYDDAGARGIVAPPTRGPPLLLAQACCETTIYDANAKKSGTYNDTYCVCPFCE